jgi:hypothetical protein
MVDKYEKKFVFLIFVKNNTDVNQTRTTDWFVKYRKYNRPPLKKAQMIAQVASEKRIEFIVCFIIVIKSPNFIVP